MIFHKTKKKRKKKRKKEFPAIEIGPFPQTFFLTRAKACAVVALR
jgi:hypothetical protein